MNYAMKLDGAILKLKTVVHILLLQPQDSPFSLYGIFYNLALPTPSALTAFISLTTH